jgi:cytochrome P450
MTVDAAHLDEGFTRFVAEGAPDPRPFYDELRREAPVYRTPFGFWHVSRYDLGVTIARDAERWTVRKPAASTHQEGNFAFDTWGRVMLMMDGPDHARLRRLVSTIFNPRGAESLRDRSRPSSMSSSTASPAPPRSSSSTTSPY